MSAENIVPTIINVHCVKSVQIRSFCVSPNTGKYGPEKTPYLDTFRAVVGTKCSTNFS